MQIFKTRKGALVLNSYSVEIYHKPNVKHGPQYICEDKIMLFLWVNTDWEMDKLIQFEAKLGN